MIRFIRWRWLLWGLIPLLILSPLISPLLRRKQGNAAYCQVIASIHAAGSPTTFDELIAAAPTIDMDAQEAWSSWSHRMTKFIAIEERLRRGWFRPEFQEFAGLDEGSPWSKPRDVNPWWLEATPHAPEALVDEMERYRTLVEEARQIVRRGTLSLTWSGAAASRLPDGGVVIGQVPRTTAWNSQHVTLVAQWLSCDALLSPSPGDDLEDLERIRRAVSPAGTTTNADCLNRINRIRDSLQLKLALARRLDAAARERWLAEPNQAFERAVDALRFSRIMSYQNAAERAISQWPFERGVNIRSPSWEDWEDWVNAPANWAEVTLILAHLEDRFRGNALHLSAVSPDPLAATSPDIKMAYRMRRFGAPHRVSASMESDCEFAMARLAMRSMLLARTAPGGLPDDQDALVQALQAGEITDPIGDHYHMLYLKLAPDRFRITVDPNGPVPDFDPGRIHAEVPVAPSPSAIVYSHCTIEIQVPGVVP